MKDIAIVQAVLNFGMLVATGTTAWILCKQYRKTNNDEWKSSDAYAFLKAHALGEGMGGSEAQEQFVFDATLNNGANYLDAGPWNTLEFPDESRLYCLDERRCQWARDITLRARLRRFLRDVRSQCPQAR